LHFPLYIYYLPINKDRLQLHAAGPSKSNQQHDPMPTRPDVLKKRHMVSKLKFIPKLIITLIGVDILFKVLAYFLLPYYTDVNISTKYIVFALCYNKVGLGSFYDNNLGHNFFGLYAFSIVWLISLWFTLSIKNQNWNVRIKIPVIIMLYYICTLIAVIISMNVQIFIPKSPFSMIIPGAISAIFPIVMIRKCKSIILKISLSFLFANIIGNTFIVKYPELYPIDYFRFIPIVKLFNMAFINISDIYAGFFVVITLVWAFSKYIPARKGEKLRIVPE
jgi:hypothetical protein